jgi:hypothetical protein
VIQIALPPDTEAKLRDRAKASGEEVAVFAARLLRDVLEASSADELLAPFRKEVAESGITDAELDQLGEELRNEVWQERKGKPA